MKAVITNFTGGRQNWGCQATSYNLHRFCEAVLRPLGIYQLSTVPFPPGSLLDQFHERRYGDRIRHAYSSSKIDDSDLRFIEGRVLSRFGAWAERVREADVVLFQGEGSIGPARHYNQTRLFGLPFVASRLWNKPVISLNQTLKAKDPRDGEALRNILSAFCMNAVREPASLAEAESIGLGEVVLCPDMAFCDMFEETSSTYGVSNEFCITGSAALRDYDLKGYCGALTQISKDVGLRPRVLISKSYDKPLFDEMRRQFGGRVLLTSSTDAPSYRDLLNVVRKSAFVIGGRYHTSISALSQGVPVILTPSNSHKSEGLAELLGLELPVIDPRQRSTLVEMAKAISADQGAWKERIFDAHGRLEAEFERFAKKMRETLVEQGFRVQAGTPDEPISKSILNSPSRWQTNSIPSGPKKFLSQLLRERNLRAFDWEPSTRERVN